MSEETKIKVRESWLSLGFWLKMIFTLGLYFFHWLGQSLTVTNKRVVWNRGLIGGKERTIPLDQVTDVAIHQGIFGSILGYGELHIETAGGPATEVVVKNISGVKKVRDSILGLG